MNQYLEFSHTTAFCIHESQPLQSSEYPFSFPPYTRFPELHKTTSPLKNHTTNHPLHFSNSRTPL